MSNIMNIEIEMNEYEFEFEYEYEFEKMGKLSAEIPGFVPFCYYSF